MQRSILAWLSLALLLPALSAAQDADGDGVLDDDDNCLLVPNAPPLDCDTDQDGFGNLCDGDFDQDGSEDSADLVSSFLPDYQSNGEDLPPEVGTDMNCDMVVDGADWNPIFHHRLTVTQTPGPSGLDCAGLTPGGCPN